MQRKFHSRGLKGISGYRHFQEQTIVGEGRKNDMGNEVIEVPPVVLRQRDEFYMWALGKQQLKG